MYKVANDVYACFEEGCAFLIRENVRRNEPFHQGFGKICKMLCRSNCIFVGGDFGLVVYSLQNRMVNYENLLHVVDKRIIHSLPIVDFDMDKKENMTISLTGNPNRIYFHMVDPTKNNRYGIIEYHMIEMPHNDPLLGAYKILHVPVDPESMIITAGKDDKIKSWKILPSDNTKFFNEISKPGVIDMICLPNNHICVAFDNFKIQILNPKFEKIRKYYIDDCEPFDYIESRNLSDRFNNEILSPILGQDGHIYDQNSSNRLDDEKIKFKKYNQIVDPHIKRDFLNLRYTQNKIERIFQPPGSKFVFVMGIIGYFQTFSTNNTGNFYYIVKVFDPDFPGRELQTVCIFVDSKITSICYDPLKDRLHGRRDIYRRTNSREDNLHDYILEEKNVEFVQSNFLENVTQDHDLKRSHNFFQDEDHFSKFMDNKENIEKMSTILYHLTTKEIKKGEFNGYSITKNMKKQLQDLISENP